MTDGTRGIQGEREKGEQKRGKGETVSIEKHQALRRLVRSLYVAFLSFKILDTLITTHKKVFYGGSRGQNHTFCFVANQSFLVGSTSVLFS